MADGLERMGSLVNYVDDAIPGYNIRDHDFRRVNEDFAVHGPDDELLAEERGELHVHPAHG
jgi:glycerol-3-phosphate cytidylyltransferase-like family protein